MFSKYDSRPTTIPSSWKTEKTFASSYAQTSEQLSADSDCQVIETREILVQTDEEDVPAFLNAEYDTDSLLKFLRRIAPQVEKEIERSNRSRAFLGYPDLKESESSRLKCVHTLRWQHTSSEQIVTDMGWNCTGSVIGVGYGVELHEDWCSHKGTVSFWNINRSDLATPEHVIEISTCVTCLTFHLSNPALVAVGNMSGEVLIYDLSKSQESTLSMTGESGGTSITRLMWVSALSKEDYHQGKLNPNLVSTTSSGHVLIWKIAYNKESMVLKSGFLVESRDVPREARSRLSDTGGVGLTSITFCSYDSSTFLLGTEGGAVLLCNASSKEPSGQMLGNVSLLRCVKSSLFPHVGKVLQTSFSPFNRHALHTLGTDNHLRIYSLLQSNKALQTIYSEIGVTCSQWSPSRPLVVATGKVTGDVSFYSFESKTSEVLRLPSADRPSPISCLKFNKNMKMISVGDHLGRVFIWELPDSVVMPTSTELTSLNATMQVVQDG